MRSSALTVAALVGAAQAAMHVITVGKNMQNMETKNEYFPDKITAQAGDEVQLQFWGGNHTVTQSTFGAPCVPMAMSGNSSGGGEGIFSGFKPAPPADAQAKGQGEVSAFTITINDTKPLWFYCSQGKHCQGGMSMVINENEGSGNTLEKYKEAAAKVQATGNSTGNPSGGKSGTSQAGSGPQSSVSGASSHYVAVPATLLLALGSAFMLL